MNRAVILGLGSNLGDRFQNLRGAVNELEKIFGTAAISGVYRSKSFFAPNEPDYLNLCALFRTTETATSILGHIHKIEVSFGRPFPRPKDYAPRTLDIDILWIENEVIDQDDLQVPHPALWERPFFLVPMVEIHQEALCPIRKKKYKERLEELDTSGVYFIGELF